MESMFLGIIIFLFLLAIFDLVVGVSNDAVNFLNSAIGSKAASFKVIMIIAGLGIFCGALMSNGMMEIARHGVFRPEQYYFQEIMCILLAVMTTDVFLLDVFNTVGMPTSTTVSMVFELMGGSFIIAIIKLMGDSSGVLTFADLLNTEKALTMILAIFLSVAVAFTFGALVQYLSRLIFTFNYKHRLKYTIALFGGVAATAIVYFMLIKGVKDAPFMGEATKAWVNHNTAVFILITFIFSTLLMQVLHWLKVNVFKVIVLLGTFALAMAFAGNDLVNFIGVPLAGYSSYLDFSSSGQSDPWGYLMGALNEPSATSHWFLVGSGFVMIVALFTSKKAQNVIKTSVDLSRQDEGEEMFGSSGVARSIVRASLNFSYNVNRYMPQGLKDWLERHFQKDVMMIEQGAAFDMVRAAVNLVVAGLLVALGTSLKLPLSTTYVTFMVAMGTSLADRAWSRDSAVYRITGVLSVIGGWFITAAAAFTLCALVTLIMYYGGIPAMVAMIVLVIILLIRSNIRYAKKLRTNKNSDEIFLNMMSTRNSAEVWALLQEHFYRSNLHQLQFTRQMYETVTDGFLSENLRTLRKAESRIENEKEMTKKVRRKEILGLRRLDTELAIQKNTWFHLGSNSCEQLIYCLIRIVAPCREHVDNNFNPLTDDDINEFVPVRNQVLDYLDDVQALLKDRRYDEVDAIMERGEEMKAFFSSIREKVMNRIQTKNINIKTSLVYLNMLQESQELVATLRHLVRATVKFEMKLTPEIAGQVSEPVAG